MKKLFLLPDCDTGPPSNEVTVSLLQAVQKGEPGARSQLIQIHGPHLRRTMIRLLGQHDPDRADLLQEVFVRAFNGIGKLTSAEALRSWLTQIAVFVAQEQFRKRRRKRWLSFVSAPPDIESPSMPSESVKEAVRCVYRVLEAMPDEERTVFVLHLFEGYELQDLVEICGLSYATVRRRFARAQELFRKRAAQYEALSPWLESNL